MAQIARISRRALKRSASLPATGADNNRIAVPAAKISPICSGGMSRDWMKAGRKGETTPNEEYNIA
jgi:hypothetical protein